MAIEVAHYSLYLVVAQRRMILLLSHILLIYPYSYGVNKATFYGPLQLHIEQPHPVRILDN